MKVLLILLLGALLVILLLATELYKDEKFIKEYKARVIRLNIAISLLCPLDGAGFDDSRSGANMRSN